MHGVSPELDECGKCSAILALGHDNVLQCQLLASRNLKAGSIVPEEALRICRFRLKGVSFPPAMTDFHDRGGRNPAAPAVVVYEDDRPSPITRSLLVLSPPSDLCPAGVGIRCPADPLQRLQGHVAPADLPLVELGQCRPTSQIRA